MRGDLFFRDSSLFIVRKGKEGGHVRLVGGGGETEEGEMNLARTAAVRKREREHHGNSSTGSGVAVL